MTSPIMRPLRHSRTWSMFAKCSILCTESILGPTKRPISVYTLNLNFNIRPIHLIGTKYSSSLTQAVAYVIPPDSHYRII